jgi:hypothetical protein
VPNDTIDSAITLRVCRSTNAYGRTVSIGVSFGFSLASKSTGRCPVVACTRTLATVSSQRIAWALRSSIPSNSRPVRKLPFT